MSSESFLFTKSLDFGIMASAMTPKEVEMQKLCYANDFVKWLTSKFSVDKLVQIADEDQLWIYQQQFLEDRFANGSSPG